MFSPVFRHFLITSEKDVPILCHRGQKFSVLHRFLAFSAHIDVKYYQFGNPISVRNRFFSTMLRQYGLLSRHLSAPQSYFPCFLLHKTSVESSYTDPSLFRTVITVLNKIFISNPKFQLLIYSVSSRTTSSKSVISLRPLTCHIPVIPGLMAILAL